MSSNSAVQDLQPNVLDALRIFEAPNLALFKRHIKEVRHASPKSFSLQNRRYLGNKYKLLSFIKEIIDSEIGEFNSLCDIFAGTGVVGAAFNTPSVKIIANDLLQSSFVSLKTFLDPQVIDPGKLTTHIDYLNHLKPTNNYFSKTFGDSYFTHENAARIGTVRQEIEKIADSPAEKFALLTSLLYAVDKVANTVGHYDAFRKDLTSTQRLVLRVPKINAKDNKKNKIYNLDANVLIRKVKVDVLYLDPPYNSRQYSDTYHVLENLAHWTKPSVTGVAKKMDRSHIKSKYSLKSAPEAFRDLIEHANAKHILLSYNNTGKSKDGRSNARITDKEIIAILEAKGAVKVFEKSYKAFTTGKSSTGGNSERIFYCRVS